MLPAVPARAMVRALAVAVAGLLVGAAGPARAADPPAPHRVDRAQERLLERLGPEAYLHAEPATGAVRSLGRLDGPLTAESERDPAVVVIDFVRRNAAALGLAASDVATLRLVRRDASADRGQILTWSQEVQGIPAAGATLRAAVDAEGQLRSLSADVAPALAVGATAPAVTAADAYRQVRGGAPAVADREGGAERATTFADGGEAALTVFREGAHDRLGWRILAPIDSQRFEDAIVDAGTGQLERSFNRVRFEGQIRHFDRHPGAANGGVQRTEPIPGGWLSGAGYSQLAGPNAHAVLDPDDEVWVVESPAPPYYVESGLDGAEDVAADAQNDWKEAFTGSWDEDVPDSWRVDEAQSATQLFWYVNRFHDHLASEPIGFDADSGNFEGDDPIIAQALDGANGPNGEGVPDAAHLNNANMLTLPDGVSGYMQMYLFGSGFPEVDGANDASLVYHEYTHGLAGRLVTYSDGWDAMWASPGGGQPGAIGEGTSDWYAMDLLVEDGLETDAAEPGDVRLGEYIDDDGTLLRYQGLDCRVGVPACPGPPGAGAGGFDLRDYGRIEGYPDVHPEVHSDGEIWAQTLWDLRRALVATRPDGIERARRYVTGGLRLAPPEPTFLHMRDAILQSAALESGAEDVDTLWQTFAARGIGWSAETSGPLDKAPRAAFDLPPNAHTGEATSVQPTSATLNAVIDPNGQATSYRFELGDDPSYDETTSLGTVAGDDPAAVAVPVTGLHPNTTYHYRVIASRGSRELAGLDRTFTTPAEQQPPEAPLPSPSPSPSPSSLPVAKVTSLSGAKVTADRKGLFKVKVRFGDAAPEGKARLTVWRKGKRLARASTAVRRGTTVTKTLRLSKTGRNVIRRGRSKMVRIELLLPDGAKLKKTIRLTRKKR
jgi:extracellular elastinolytic metalloproteinase